MDTTEVQNFQKSEIPTPIDSLLSRDSGVLCIGYLLTEFQKNKLRRPLEIRRPVWLVEFTTGGTSTISKCALAILARLPRETPLAILTSSYYGSNLPGYTDWLDWKTPFNQVVELSKRLVDIGLEIDSNEYASFSEALIPISLDSTLDYLKSNALEIIVNIKPNDSNSETNTLGAAGTLHHSNFSILNSPRDTLDFLHSTARMIDAQVNPGSIPAPFGHVFGFSIVDNSD